MAERTAESGSAEKQQQCEPEWWERAPEYTGERDEEAAAAEAALFEALARWGRREPSRLWGAHAVLSFANLILGWIISVAEPAIFLAHHDSMLRRCTWLCYTKSVGLQPSLYMLRAS